jgi:uncharacterized membrane protein YeaQ/YmgE (transglycosylase-associated protein family)
MSFILWLVIGGLLGWVASIVMGTNDTQGKFLNIVVGVVGAFLGGLLIAPLFGTGTINQYDFSFGSLFTSLLGAILLIAIVGFFRRRRRA